jgi:hypothetical protein
VFIGDWSFLYLLAGSMAIFEHGMPPETAKQGVSKLARGMLKRSWFVVAARS